MLGKPDPAMIGSSRSDSAVRRSCSLGRLKPTSITEGPLAMAQVSPKRVTVLQSFSSGSSTDARPISLALRQSSSTDIRG